MEQYYTFPLSSHPSKTQVLFTYEGSVIHTDIFKLQKVKNNLVYILAFIYCSSAVVPEKKIQMLILLPCTQV